jgi:hypothetical protein
MDTKVQVEVLRLHCDHLRTLLDRVIDELTTMQHELATDGNPSFTTIAPHLNGLEKQSEKIAIETLRFQSFLHSLGPQKTDASGATEESPHASSSSTSDTLKRGRYKIVCTLDGKEPAVILYEKYAEPDTRIFPNGWHAIAIHEYLSKRAQGMRWNPEPPSYDIVPVEE